MAIISGLLDHTLYNWPPEHIRASLAPVALLSEPLRSTLLAIAIPQINQIPSQYAITWWSNNSNRYLSYSKEKT